MAQLKLLPMSHRCYICYRNDLPEGQYYHPACNQIMFDSDEAPEMPYSLADMKDLAKKIIQSRHVVTGVQPKISMGIEKTKRKRGRLTLIDNTYIIKPPSEKFPQLPENEDLTMHLAGIAEIYTVPHALISLASGELAYITKRIDRVNGKKVHMEDLCQLSEIITENKYKSTMERVGKVVAKYSSAPGLDLVNLFELTLFCYITGNNDMHLKNFSLINDRGWILSPAYDLLNVAIANPKDKEETAMSITGKKSNFSSESFVKLGVNFGLNDRQIGNAIRKIKSPFKEYHEMIDQSFLSEDNKELYLTVLNNRLEVI